LLDGLNLIAYEKPMGRSRVERADSSPGGEGWMKLLASVSLGSIIGGAFAVAHDWSSRDQQRCTLATQFLGDETPGPALSLADRQRLVAVAHSRLLGCLGDD
jgi:hypothetical protein